MVNCCPKWAEQLVISQQSYRPIGCSVAVGRVPNNAQLCTANSIEQLGKIQKRGFAGCAGIRSQSRTARAVNRSSPDAENTLESAFSSVFTSICGAGHGRLDRDFLEEARQRTGDPSPLHDLGV